MSMVGIGQMVYEDLLYFLSSLDLPLDEEQARWGNMNTNMAQVVVKE